jgi:hypothetical protein
VGDEPQVAGLVALVHVDAIQFETRLIQPLKREDIPQEGGFVGSPRLIDDDAARAVVGVARVLRIVAAVLAGRQAVEKSPAVAIIRAGICVLEVVFSPISGCLPGADTAASRCSFE